MYSECNKLLTKDSNILQSTLIVIHNICTNDLSNAPDTISGILIDDFLHHFPIFNTIKDCKKNSKGNNEFKYMLHKKKN